jgi:hypothetical protein
MARDAQPVDDLQDLVMLSDPWADALAVGLGAGHVDGVARFATP